jgi:glutathione synthase/RimK-type ligase-like ATP-grasp enzyme
MKKIILLTNYKNIIPQRNHEIEGLKLNLISEVLENNNFDVELMSLQSFVSFLSKNQNIENYYFYYASSQYPIYKSFIQDILVQIDLRGGILVPSFRHFLAHENKNFQELEKVRIGLESPYGIPVGTYEEGIEILKKIKYPVVIKKSTGFRSRNVKIARNYSESKRTLSKLLENNFRFDMESFYYLYRRIYNKTEYPKRFGKVIIQEFIPDLTYDWKILVLGSKILGVKRFVRENDFRASGSKLYDLDEIPPSDVLDFALSCKNKIQSPNVSMDICKNGDELKLLEYQTMHFGILGGDPVFYFERENGKWEQKNITEEMEYYIGLGICEYILELSKN